MTTSPTSYDDLLAHLRQLHALQYCVDALQWDRETMMPAKGGEARAEAVATMEGLIHAKKTDRRLDAWLDALADGGDDPVRRANLRETRRMLDRARKVPGTLVEELARVTTLGHGVWAEARSNKRFADFAPTLKKVVDLKREEAACIGFDATPYDALLDEFEPGMTAAELEPMFDSLRAPLSELTQRIAESGVEAPKVTGPFPEAEQLALSKEIATTLGYDFEAGRLDLAVHPFTSGMVPGDVRITTRVNEEVLDGCLFSVVHEVGHGLYEQGVLTERQWMPAGHPTSLGVHESQSRLWENQVGRGLPFAQWLLPRLRERFPTLSTDDPEVLHRSFNRVERSFIRTESDEVTYNLHIILRFELERALIEDRLAVSDLEGAWNDKMQEYLGITPPDPAQGVLQDVHWALGAIGYFPTYTLGNLYSAELFAAARAQLGDIDAQIAQGEMKPLLDWLRAEVHSQGSIYPAKQLIERVVGHAPSEKPLVGYLQAKFGALYALD